MLRFEKDPLLTITKSVSLYRSSFLKFTKSFKLATLKKIWGLINTLLSFISVWLWYKPYIVWLRDACYLALHWSDCRTSSITHSASIVLMTCFLVDALYLFPLPHNFLMFVFFVFCFSTGKTLLAINKGLQRSVCVCVCLCARMRCTCTVT